MDPLIFMPSDYAGVAPVSSAFPVPAQEGPLSGASGAVATGVEPTEEDDNQDSWDSFSMKVFGA